ncbi:MAG: YheT family hydrolase [Cytophagaceae bacterium]
MPIIEKSDYKSPFYLFSRHLQTILPALFRRVGNVCYERIRITTPDQDFLDLDWSRPHNSEHLIILSHGLEGDSYRPYVLGMVRAMNMQGFDVLAWNYRGCSGENNKHLKSYHSGETNDLHYVINHVLNNHSYKNITLIGFSVGGNIVLKYLGENPDKVPIQVINSVTFSVPCHLESGAHHLAKFKSRIYMRRFLHSLEQKIKEKSLLWPEQCNALEFNKISNFMQFDTLFTAPVNGYKDAIEYWTKNSSIFYLKNINKPTLIVTAKNDPFLAPQCYPYKEAKESKFIYLETPSSGGHCGFYEKNQEGIYWSEKRAIEFLLNNR